MAQSYQQLQEYPTLSLHMDGTKESNNEEDPMFTLKSVLISKKEVIMTVRFSTGGELLAAGSLDAKIHIWDVCQGIILKTLRGHKLGIMDLAWSHNDTLLASASMDKSIILWDVVSGRPFQILKRHNSGVFRCTFSPKSFLLASGSTKGIIHLWDVKTGNVIKTFRKHSGMISSICFNTEGTLILASNNEGVWFILDVASEECLQSFKSNDGTPISAVSFLLDERFILVATYLGVLELWDFSGSIEEMYRFKNFSIGDDEYLSVMTAGTGETFIVSGSKDNRSLKIWDLERGNIEQELKCHIDLITCTACHEATKMIATAALGDDSTIKIWNSIY